MKDQSAVQQVLCKHLEQKLNDEGAAVDRVVCPNTECDRLVDEEEWEAIVQPSDFDKYKTFMQVLFVPWQLVVCGCAGWCVVVGDGMLYSCCCWCWWYVVLMMARCAAGVVCSTWRWCDGVVVCCRRFKSPTIRASPAAIKLTAVCQSLLCRCSILLHCLSLSRCLFYSLSLSV